MVLVGDRRTEDRHDAVTEDLIHRALVSMHGIDHDLLQRVEYRTDRLGVEVLHQVGRTLDVGKEDGDLLAFALDRSACAQDLLGELRRRMVRGLCRGGRIHWRFR
jgi:hypothetical protein